jgi:hypothetical protein
MLEEKKKASQSREEKKLFVAFFCKLKYLFKAIEYNWTIAVYDLCFYSASSVPHHLCLSGSWWRGPHHPALLVFFLFSSLAFGENFSDCRVTSKVDREKAWNWFSFERNFGLFLWLFNWFKRRKKLNLIVRQSFIIRI